MAIAPLLIRWDMDASSDRLRGSPCCSRCEGKGAVIQRPSWLVRDGDWQPFPAQRRQRIEDLAQRWINRAQGLAGGGGHQDRQGGLKGRLAPSLPNTTTVPLTAAGEAS